MKAVCNILKVIPICKIKISDLTFIVLCSKVDGDMMEAVDTSQVHPPGYG